MSKPFRAASTLNLADPDDLTYKEVESVVYGLSFAGHEIVSNFLGNSLVCVPSLHLVEGESAARNARTRGTGNAH